MILVFSRNQIDGLARICHSQITREAVLKGVINSMSNSDCDKCIYQCALFCQFLSQARRKNKTLLLEHKVVVVLNSLLNQSLDSKTRGLCQELESSLAIRLPEQHVIMNQRCVDTDSPRSTPAVTWVQDTFKIVLAVKVSGAKKEDFNVKENSVHFRRSLNGINQQFDYELFGEILPQKTGISIRPSEVLLSLRKVEKGKWSRLTKDKQKLSSLTVDFEKMATSSDSEVSEEEDPFILVKGKRKLPRHPPDEPIKKDHLEYPEYSDESESLLSLSDEENLGEDRDIFD
ncbi:uncharacterized protein LOC121389125 [Gigantopelta aegis]|uniref:uncharacterized protein LOC121389125 n=1 Tax=Gigantopelta aegis TaxID=1735272 RepID=UPI001B88BDC6|nr:uncharacterized protein LOC121389125 [Gigantopelta aegis]